MFKYKLTKKKKNNYVYFLGIILYFKKKMKTMWKTFKILLEHVLQRS